MVGVDIVAIARMERFLDRFGQRALRRFLNESELPLAKNAASAAGLWAAKEAVAKAFGCGIGAELGFHDIIISKDPKGAPRFRLSPKAMERFGPKSCSLSIAHDGGFAIAVVAVEIDSPASDKCEEL